MVPRTCLSILAVVAAGCSTQPRWKKDREGSITSIVLGGSAPIQMDAITGQSSGKTAAPTAHDPATRTIRYRMGPATESLQFAGFVFFRKTQCSAAQSRPSGATTPYPLGGRPCIISGSVGM